MLCRHKITANGLGLCEEAEFEAQMFGLAQMFIRIPNVQFSTEPAFSQNPCCAIVLIHLAFLLSLKHHLQWTNTIYFLLYSVCYLIFYRVSCLHFLGIFATKYNQRKSSNNE